MKTWTTLNHISLRDRNQSAFFTQQEVLVGLGLRLEELGIPYMVIGGLANAVWGEPRATLDIDVTVAADTSEVLRIAAGLEPELNVLVPNPESFVLETRVLPLQSRLGVRVDELGELLTRPEIVRSWSKWKAEARRSD